MSDWSTFTRLRVTNNDPTLTTLSLSIYTLTPAIAEALQRNTTITSLSLLDGHLPRDSARILGTKTSLTALNIWIGRNTLSLSSLQEIPRWTTLKTLRIRNTSLLNHREGFETNTLPIICRSQSLEELSVEHLLAKKITKMMVRLSSIVHLHPTAPIESRFADNL